MFYTIEKQRTEVKKTRSLNVGDEVVIRMNDQIIEDVVLLHTNPELRISTFLLPDTGRAIQFCDGILLGQGRVLTSMEIVRKSEMCAIDVTTLKYEYTTFETRNVESQIKEGQVIQMWVHDDLVDMKVLYSGKKLVMIEPESEEIYEIDEVSMPNGLAFNYEVIVK